MKIKYVLATLALLISYTSFSQWIDFEDETDQRIVVANAIDNDNANLVDDQEKDLATGDFNNDSFVDLVVVRKFPFSNAGKRVDLLFMNRNGVLNDETNVFAPEFISNPTDARDVICTDVNNDDWLDIVIISTFDDPPRLYINQGENGDGDWLGFVDESSTRLPDLSAIQPFQYCAVAAADITGDGFVEIYMANYAFGEVAPDVLLINDGNGNFTDETDARLGDLRNSSFGTAIEFHDVDNDGDLDVVKNLGLQPIEPFDDMGVFTLFNNGDGTFTNWFRFPTNTSYMMTGADLDENGLLDFYIVDDSEDYVHSITDFVIDESLTIEQTFIPTNRTDQFGGNVKIIDLDGDGDLDVGMSSVDVDIPPCETPANRRFIIFENEGDASGNLVHPYGATINDWNVSSHDHDYIDLNNDGFMDIILGICDGYQVFIQRDPTLSVGETSLEPLATIFPNPNNGQMNINLNTQLANNLTVELYSLSGRLLRTAAYDFTLSNTLNIDMRTVTQSGIYFLKMTTPDGISTTQKVIVE